MPIPGLKFLPGVDGGGHVIIYDSLTENAGIYRESVVSKEDVDDLITTLRPKKVRAARATSRKGTRKTK